MVIGLLIIWKHACIEKALEDVFTFPFLYSLLGNDIGDEIENRQRQMQRIVGEYHPALRKRKRVM